MADQKISELTALTGANVADDDAIAIVDTSATETKKIVFSELKNALDTATGFVRITGDTMTGDLSMGDNVKAIFGNGSDLQIYHDGDDSYVQDTAAGKLILKSNGPSISFQKGDGTELFTVNTSGSSTLSYSGNPRLATTSTGIDVTGTVTADAFQSDSGNTNYNLLARNSSNVAAYIQNGGSGPVLEARSGSMSAGQGDLHLKVDNNGDISFFEDTGTTAKLHWSASDERLGIGTTNPTRALHVNSGASNEVARFESTDTEALIELVDTTGSAQIRSRNDLRFYTNGGSTRAMDIDSSGNVLVGKTSTAVNTQGIQLGNNGRFYATSDGAESAVFNRKTSDGVIASFRKDNTTVGSIGTLTDDLSIGNLDTGLIFQGAGERISPFNPATNTYRDAAIDLGYTTRRFKDLYLSGGVYLGGTGSANKLDDYEEGTFTPFIRINNGVEGITVSHASGAYVKVGSAVHIILRWRLTSKGSNVGNVRLDGLPFTVGDRIGTTGLEGGATIGHLSGMAGTWTNVVAYPSEGETEIGFSIRTGTTGDYTAMTNSNIGNLFDGRIACTYFVD